MLCEPERLTALYMHVLNDRLGVSARPKPEGKVSFETHGWKYLIHNLAPRDPELLVMTLSFDLEEDCGRVNVLALANDIHARAGGAQVHLTEGCVAFACQMIVAGPHCLPSPQHLAAILPRCVTMLDKTAERFFDDLELAGITAASTLEAS